MKQKTFILALSSIMLGTLALPLDPEIVKVYLISVILFTTGLVNLLFNLKKVREWIVDRLMADFWERLFLDEELRVFLGERFRRKYFDERKIKR